MNNQATVAIRPPQDGSEQAEYFGLRYHVLRMPFGYEPDSAKDEFDNQACWNLAAFLGNSIIGVARLHCGPAGEYVIRWVAVNPNHRHRKVGSLLISALEAVARHQGAHSVELVSRNTAVGFYTKLGYTKLDATNPVLDVAGKPVMEQTNMSKAL